MHTNMEMLAAILFPFLYTFLIGEFETPDLIPAVQPGASLTAASKTQ